MAVGVALWLERRLASQNLKGYGFKQGTLTFKEGEVSVRLTSLYLLVRNQLFQEELKIIFFIF